MEGIIMPNVTLEVNSTRNAKSILEMVVKRSDVPELVNEVAKYLAMGVKVYISLVRKNEGGYGVSVGTCIPYSHYKEEVTRFLNEGLVWEE
jgi:hypothetical protein